MPQLSVTAIDVVKEAIWDFRDSSATWRHPVHSYSFSAVFDPFPGYSHDLDVIRETAREVQERIPPIWDVELFVADREETSRTNGFSSVRQRHYDDEMKTNGFIMLGGKRIPPHPAMTRYLVAHEYGHNLSYMLSHARGEKNVHDTPWMKDYAIMRGLDPDQVYHHGNGGTWHDSIHEVFACDFRIAVCGIEREFWPHPGISRTDEEHVWRPVIAWWQKAMSDLGGVA